MKKTILILEDDLRIATALSIRIKAAGYNAVTANDGLEGLKLALENSPDLILMDIWMPIGIGFSVAQRLRALGLGGIPIIFITASKQKGLRKVAHDLGAVGFFEKPYEPEQLMAGISQALGTGAHSGRGGGRVPCPTQTTRRGRAQTRNTAPCTLTH
jgi:DNA-binding response OmpR family regulator